MSMLVNSFLFDMTPPPVGVAYSRFRINTTAIQPGGDFLGAAEIYLRDAIGTDLTSGTPSGITASASSTFSGYPASDAFIPNLNYFGWLNDGGATAWLRATFTVARDVRSLTISQRLNESDRMPKDFTIEYSDDGGATWGIALTVVNQTAWGLNEIRKYVVAASGAHFDWRINVSAVNGGSYVGIGSFIMKTATDEVLTLTLQKAYSDRQSAFSNVFEAAYAFNRTAQYYVAAAATGWVDVFLATPAIVTKLGWTPVSGETDRCPRDFTFSGWNETTQAFELLATYSGASGYVAGVEKEFAI